jgi:hypothetical protein
LSGYFVVHRGLFEDPMLKDEPFGEREAYIWIGMNTPVPQKHKWLARRWRWSADRCRRFVYRLANAGLVKISGTHISYVPIDEAVPSPIDGRWRNLREAVFARDGHACVYCGSSDELACDHIVPRSRGGQNTMANLATACRPCNSSKRDKTPEEWLGARHEANA